MSPASALAFHGKAPSTPDTSSASSSLWCRMDQMIQQDAEKTEFLKEVLIRYDYITQEYQRECDERAREHEAIRIWQGEKEQFLNTYRSMQIMMEKNPFVVVLIDGDGMIFQNDLIRDGEQGGRRAAAQIHSAVVNFIQQEAKDIPNEARIICRIYANVRGLAEVLIRTGVIPDVATFEDFARGFTRGKTLFDFVDVGPGKDRADEKLIESFKLYTEDMHCRHILYGCSHDNGYARVLEDNMSDPVYLRKVTLLEGVPFEKELRVLPYNTHKFEGLFRSEKIAPTYPQAGVIGSITPVANGVNGGPCALPAVAKNYNIISGLPSRFPAPVRSNIQSPLMDSPIPTSVLPNLPRTPSSSSFASMDGPIPAKPAFMNYAAKAALPAPPTPESPAYKPVNREEVIARNRTGQRIDPPCRDYDKTEVDRIKKIKMCNVHFLRDECPYGPQCTHLHNYKPTKDEILTLRLVARMAPCSNGSGCQDIKCMYGHRCPAPQSNRAIKGTKSCIFGESCKFPPELHDIDTNVVNQQLKPSLKPSALPFVPPTAPAAPMAALKSSNEVDKRGIENTPKSSFGDLIDYQ